MKLSSFRFFLLTAAFAIGPILSAAPTLAGHVGLKGQTIDADAIKAILLGKRVNLGDARVIIVIAKAGEAQEAFLQRHVGMSTSQFQNHWRRLFMTGGGSAPKIVDTEADACKTASETPGAIVMADEAATANLAVLAK